MRSSAAAKGVGEPATRPIISPGPSASSYATVERLPNSRSKSSSAAGSLPISESFARISRADLLFLNLLGEEPLELDRSGKRLLLEGELVEGVDLLADRLLLLQDAVVDVVQRRELLCRRRHFLQRDLTTAREHEVEELHGVPVFLLALEPQPFGAAEEVLRRAPRRHGEVFIRRPELGVDLLIEGVLDGSAHAH